MAPTLQPFVFWAQNERDAFLSIAVRDVEDSNLNLDVSGSNFSFSTTGNGAQGQTSKYALDESLFSNVTSVSKKVSDSKIEIVLHKAEPLWWPRLTETAVRRPWLKIDFDKWTDPDAESAAESSEEESAGKQMRRLLKMDEKEEDSWATWRQNAKYYRARSRQVYLTMFNVMLFLGHAVIVAQLAIGYANKREAFFPLVWSLLAVRFQWLIATQTLEIVHALLGWTKTNFLAATVQVGGRAFVVMVIMGLEPRMYDKPIVFYVFFVYAMIEVFRYPYYALAVNKIDVGIVTWLRYTMWMPLYPLGFLCEATIALRAIPYYMETGRLSVRMPNRANVSFDFAYFLGCFLLFAFMPAVVYLLGHMRRQRQAKLRNTVVQSAKKSK